MQEFHRRYRWVCAVVAVVFMLTVMTVPAAQARMISTQALATGAAVENARARINAMLERSDVQAQLIALGVDPQAARDRVAALSGNEVQALARHMDSMPAGGSALGLIIGVGLFVFLVLLVTDILGYTDVYPFIKKTAR